MILPVSLTFAGALALVNLWLASRIVRLRLSEGQLIGAGGNPVLEARMRAQANFAEYTPFVLILMALLELGGASTLWLRVAGALYVIARLLHAFGMDRHRSNPLRAGGAVATWLILLALAGWALWIASHPAAGVVRLL